MFVLLPAALLYLVKDKDKGCGLMTVEKNFLQDLKQSIEKNDKETVLQMLRKPEKKWEDHPAFFKLKAAFYMQERKYKDAIACLALAKTVVPEDFELYSLLVEAYEALEKSQIIRYDLPELKLSSCKEQKALYQRRVWIRNQLLLQDAPTVSICVLAYNHLADATQRCIECVLKYTKDIEYELILVDNGSSDETLSYFRSVPYKRKKIVRVEENKGAMYGWHVGMQAMEGKYFVALPNDVWVTKNWLKNMLACIESDDSIGMVVPMSDNTSNFQDPGIVYSDFTDMQQKAEAFNVSNPLKWQERLRLITIAALCRRECIDIMRFYDYGYVYNFADDDVSFRFRRYGYKLMVCGDVFVHHIGSVVVSNRNDSFMRDLEQGKKDFKQKFFGICAWEDTWQIGGTEMVGAVLNGEWFSKGRIDILGIEVRCGSILLELKHKLQAQGASKEVRLTAFSSEARYWTDLYRVCSQKIHVGRIESFSRRLYQDHFDFIFIGEPLNYYSSLFHIMEQALLLLKPGGRLSFLIVPTENVKVLFQEADGREKEVLQVTQQSVCSFLNRYEAFSYKSIHVCANTENQQFAAALESLSITYLQQAILQNIRTAFYLFVIERKNDA